MVVLCCNLPDSLVMPCMLMAWVPYCAVLCAACASGGLNAAATSIYIDIIDNAMGKGVPPEKVVRLTRGLTVILALVSIGLAFASAAIPGLVKQSVSLMGLALGPLFAVNVLGMATTTANWQVSIDGSGQGNSQCRATAHACTRTLYPRMCTYIYKHTLIDGLHCCMSPFFFC